MWFGNFYPQKACKYAQQMIKYIKIIVSNILFVSRFILEFSVILVTDFVTFTVASFMKIKAGIKRFLSKYK
jgi:hypothetical protein